MERTRRGEGAGNTGSEAQEEYDGERYEEKVNKKASLEGEVSCPKSKSDKGNKEKGPQSASGRSQPPWEQMALPERQGAILEGSEPPVSGGVQAGLHGPATGKPQ